MKWLHGMLFITLVLSISGCPATKQARTVERLDF